MNATTITRFSTRSSVLIALVAILVSGLSTSSGAVRASGPLLPDVTISDVCRSYGPEGSPKIRIKITNLGNDRAENRLGITAHITVGQTNATAILYPSVVISLQAGESMSTTMGLPGNFLSESAKNLSVRLHLNYVANGTTKTMEEHSTANNRFDAKSYFELSPC